MKASLLTEYGPPQGLRYGDASDPVAGEGEVIVDVRAASVNAVDHMIRRGEGPYSPALPYILGRDFSGVVAAVGPNAGDFEIGALVFGVVDLGRDGAYAQKLAMKAEIIAEKPGLLSHAETAALGLTALTGLTAIEDAAQLRHGETILIHGGAGGVGGFAIQLARHLGARVIATASHAKLDYVQSLGVDMLIDYENQDFVERAGLCDVVFDAVGGDVQVKSYDVLKPGGRLVWIAPGPPGVAPPRTDVQVLRPNVVRSRPQLQRIVDLVQSGHVSPPRFQSFDLSEAAAAHELAESRQFQGKLVLEVA